jgi:predicted RNase H-like HicB family nuclease
MKTRAIIERGQDGMFSVFTPDLKSTIIGEGSTVAEAKADFEHSVNELKGFFTEEGIEDNELNGIEFDYFWDISSVLHHFDWINITKFANRHKFNTSLLHQYKSNAYISDEQARKIMNALQDDAREILSVNMREVAGRRKTTRGRVAAGE